MASLLITVFTTANYPLVNMIFFFCLFMTRDFLVIIYFLLAVIILFANRLMPTITR